MNVEGKTPQLQPSTFFCDQQTRNIYSLDAKYARPGRCLFLFFQSVLRWNVAVSTIGAVSGN